MVQDFWYDNNESSFNTFAVVSDSSQFTLEGSAVNLMNHANFAAPGLNISSSSFGVISSTQGQEGSGARQLQVSLRYTF